MYKLPWTIIALALAALTLAAFAPPLHAQAPQGVGGNAFSCEVVDEGPNKGDTMCNCKGVSDCSRMAGSGICKGDGKTDDTACIDDDFNGGTCSCTMGGAKVSQGHDLRPKAMVPATRNAPRNRNTRDHRARHPTGHIAQPPLAPDAKPLTRGECTELGGVVKTLSVCKSTGFGLPGKACITTDQHGSNHAVCLNVASASSRRIEPASKPTRRTGSRPTSATNTTTVAPLTSQECKGLGGSVLHTNQCSAKGQEACSTVDKHGVVRVACINKVAAD